MPGEEKGRRIGTLGLGLGLADAAVVAGRVAPREAARVEGEEDQDGYEKHLPR